MYYEGRFDFLPMPYYNPDEKKFSEPSGVHPKVCCPGFVPDDSICFPTDTFCPTYDYDYENTAQPSEEENLIKVNICLEGGGSWSIWWTDE